jgi:hypothetical protein
MRKGKAIRLQALTGPEGSRRLKLPDFKTIDTCQPYAPAALTPRKYSWYPFLLETESTPGPKNVSRESKFHSLIRDVEEEKTDIDHISGSQSGYITPSFIICVLRV